MGSDDIGGKEIGRELDAAKASRKSLCEGVDSEGFGETGEAFDEEVVTGEEADQHAVDEVMLPDEDAGDFRTQRGDESGTGLDFSGEFFWSHESVSKISEWEQKQPSTVLKKSDRAIGRTPAYRNVVKEQFFLRKVGFFRLGAEGACLGTWSI